MKSILIALFVFIAVACSGPQKTTLNISQPNFFMPVVIFPLGNETIGTNEITKNAIDILADFRNYDVLPDSVTNSGYRVTTALATDSSFLPPQALLMAQDYLLMERTEVSQLAVADRNIQFLFFGTGTDIVNKQAAISKFISSVTDGKSVAIYDFSSGQAYNHEAWQKVRTESFQAQPMNINDHIVFHAYRESEYCRIVSLGMSKFSLPELSVTNVPCHNQDDFTMVMNALAQTLFEDPNIYSDSSVLLDVKKIKNADVKFLFASNQKAKGSTVIQLRNAVPQPGDVPFLQFEVAFTNKEYSSPQEEQMAMLKDMFGMDPEVVESTEHDEELLKASELARQRLPELRKMFNDGLEPGVSIVVKSPFKREDADGSEWMWVEVTKWTDTGMEGILQNEPNYVKGLTLGSTVNINEIEIFDYVLMKADGSMEGNETGKVLEQRSGNH